jgi:hypothetical protein
MTEEKQNGEGYGGGNIVAIIFPQSGGYMARLLPIGIDCYSETLDGLHEEISKVIKDYNDYIGSVDFEEWFEEDSGFTSFSEKIPGSKGSYVVESQDDWLQ